MRSNLPLFAFGLATGMFLMWAITPTQPPPPLPLSEDKKTQRYVKLALAQVGDRMRLLEDQDAKLQAELAELRTTAAALAALTNAVLQSRNSADADRAAAMSQMIQATMRQQVEMKLSALRLRLHLTGEQEQSVRDLMEKQSAWISDVTTRALEGKSSQEDVEKQARVTAELQEQLQRLLTPEQQAEYEYYQAQERQAQAEMAANVELAQLQSMLQLDQHQQEQAYLVFCEQAEQNINQTDGGIRVALDWEKQLDDKEEAMRAVLTSEQFQSYERLLDSQREMMKAFIPKP